MEIIKKITKWVLANKGKVIAGILVVLPALFTMLESTGWGILSKEQHDALIQFIKTVLPVFG